MAEHPNPDGRRRLALAAAVVVLAVSGVVLIAAATRTPGHAPQPSPLAFGSLDSFVGATPEPLTDETTLPSSPPSSLPEVGPLVPAPSPPVAIDIHAIGVHSTLLHLGLTDENTLEVPAHGPFYDLAAWYKYSSTPGSPGPAVILGHVDSAANGPSVFFSLGDLLPGDEILVTRADGLVAVFVVNGVRSYPKAQFPTALVYGPTDGSTLRLITCGGDFDKAAGHYQNNVIVFASLVELRELTQPFAAN